MVSSLIRLFIKKLNYSEYSFRSHLVLVPHGALAQDRNLGSGVLLQSFDGAALGTENLPHKVELNKTKKRDS